jgi:hypothetical protein
MSECLVRQKALITAYQCVNKLEGFSETVTNQIEIVRRGLKAALSLQVIEMGDSARENLRQLEIPFPAVVVNNG